MAENLENDDDLERTDEFPAVRSEDVDDFAHDANYSDDPLEKTGEHDTQALQLLPSQASGDPESASAHGDVRQLQDTVAQLSERWQDLEGLLASNAEALASVQSELAQSHRELRESHEKQQSLLGQLADRDSERAALQASVDAAEKAAHEATSKAADLAQRLEDAEDELGETEETPGSKAEKADSTDTAPDSRPEHDEADTREESGPESDQQQLADAAAVHAQLERRLTDETEHRQRVERELAEQTAIRDDLESRLADEIEARLSRKDAASTAALQQKVEELESYIAGRKDRWEEMEALLSEKTTRIGELEEELKFRVRQKEQLEERLGAERMLAKTYRSEIESLMAAEGLAPPSEDSDRASRLQQALRESEHSRKRLQTLVNNLQETYQPPPRAETSSDTSALEIEPGATDDTLERPAVRGVLMCLTGDTSDRNEIEKDETTIGRGDECDIKVRTHYVSRVHAALHRRNGKFEIEDKQSTNGVFVNSIKVKRTTLAHGDWVTIGETQFRFVEEAQDV